MAAPTAPPTRGAARRARTDDALAAAVANRLREQGYAGLTIEGVSAESGVAKTTIYRRWTSKAEMVFDLMIHRADPPSTVDTGTLSGDVRALADRAVALVATYPGRDVLPGLLADMSGDSALAARLRESFVDVAREDIRAVLERAITRGEVSHDADAEAFHAALLGIPYALVHLLADDDVERLAARVSDQLLRLLPR